MVGIIYKTTNLINGKIYIGQHTRGLESYIGSGSDFMKAVSEFGKENFKKEILEEGIENRNVLDDREKYWIKVYDATNPEIGYNKQTGGHGGYEVSEETKALQSELKQGENNPMFGRENKCSDEKREKIIENMPDMSGENNPMYGTHGYYDIWVEKYGLERANEMQAETNKKHSESQSGEKNGMFNKKHKEESKEIMKQKKLGVKLTDEHKHNLSVAIKAGWAKRKAKMQEISKEIN